MLRTYYQGACRSSRFSFAGEFSKWNGGRGSSSPGLATRLAQIGHLDEPAEGIREHHLARRATLRFEQPRRGDDDRRAARTGSGDVEAIQAVEELHPARRVFGA